MDTSRLRTLLRAFGPFLEEYTMSKKQTRTKQRMLRLDEQDRLALEELPNLTWTVTWADAFGQVLREMEQHNQGRDWHHRFVREYDAKPGYTLCLRMNDREEFSLLRIAGEIGVEPSETARLLIRWGAAVLSELSRAAPSGPILERGKSIFAM